MTEAGHGADLAVADEGAAAQAHSPTEEAIAAMRAAETRALHVIAAASRRVMTRLAAELRHPSLGAALAEEIDQERHRIRREQVEQEVMLRRLETLEAPQGPVLQLFCDMAEACRRRLADLGRSGEDHARAFQMVRSAGPLLTRDADVAVVFLTVE